jgi:uncharacterized protein (TIRG00374 family)
MAKLLRWLMLFLGAAILIFFISTLDIQELKKSIGSISIPVILMLLMLNCINILIKAWRWQYLIRKLTGVRITLPFSFASIVAGVATGVVTPGRLGEVAKPLMLKTSDNISLTKTVPAMIIERILDLFAVVFFFLVSFLIIPRNVGLYNRIIIPAIILFIGGVMLVFFVPRPVEHAATKIIKMLRLSKKLEIKLLRLTGNFFQSFMIIKQQKVSLIITILTLGAFMLEIVRQFFLFSMLGAPASVMIVTFSFTASLIFALVTFIPGGVGVTEISQAAIISAILPQYGKSVLSGIVFLDRILTYYLLVVVGAVILLVYNKSNKKSEKKGLSPDIKKDVKEWNKELNIKHSMNLLEKHPNPLIRIEEKDRRRIIIGFMGDCTGKIIADVGCEEGYITKSIITKAAKVYCIDIDKNLLTKAKHNINNKKAVFIESDAQSIKLPDNSVDIAISSHVLEHLPNPKKGVAELYRIVKPGGRVIINVPNENVVLFVKKVIVFLKLNFLIKNLNAGLAPGHLHIFNKRMLISVTKDYFKPLRIRYNPPFYTNVFAVLKPIKRFK